jgi:hypothetical protein
MVLNIINSFGILKLLVMCCRLEQETLTSEYRTEVTQMMMEIELEKKKSHDLDLELQREEQLANVLLDRLKEIRASNSSMEQQVRPYKGLWFVFCHYSALM